MKNIEDAVIELGGKAPERTFSERTPNNYYISTNCICLNGEVICHIPDFIEQAKRLGYISGYRWGIEYPTNGKRPELADDVLIEYKNTFHGDKWVAIARAGNLVYQNNGGACPVTSFKITDPRYKPADTSYLNAASVVRGDPSIRDELNLSKSLTHSEEGLTYSEWWDYENDCLLSKPPVGEVVLLPPKFDEKSQASVVGFFKDETVLYSHRTESYFGCDFAKLNINPFDYAARKAELKREKVIEAAVKLFSGGNIYDMYNTLYDAGMLVLPPKKSDTKD